ncbi:MAG: hypothetical protein AAFP70_17925, partial [Calditrichota bacterium]
LKFAYLILKTDRILNSSSQSYLIKVARIATAKFRMFKLSSMKWKALNPCEAERAGRDLQYEIIKSVDALH